MPEVVFEKYLFVVDTDSYAGNFERELSEHLVNASDEWGDHDEKFAEQFPQIVEELEEILLCGSDHAVFRLYSTPGYFNDGLGNEYTTMSDEVVRRFEESVKKAHLAESTKEELLLKGPGKHPSMQSVAIQFSHYPSDNLMKHLVERAASFPSAYSKQPFASPLKILNVRLLLQETCVTERGGWDNPFLKRV